MKSQITELTIVLTEKELYALRAIAEKYIKGNNVMYHDLETEKNAKILAQNLFDMH